VGLKEEENVRSYLESWTVQQAVYELRGVKKSRLTETLRSRGGCKYVNPPRSCR